MAYVVLQGTKWKRRNIGHKHALLLLYILIICKVFVFQIYILALKRKIVLGWQENPVDFDSVFNQSRRSYCWGSCDIIPMFKSKVTSKHVIGDCYKEDMIDFSDENGARLDEWVFSRVEQFFLSAQKNKTLNDQVRSDKLVLFLHLLGKKFLCTKVLLIPGSIKWNEMYLMNQY